MQINDFIDAVAHKLTELNESLEAGIIVQAVALHNNRQITSISQSAMGFDFLVEGTGELVSLLIDTFTDEESGAEKIVDIYPESRQWATETYACLMFMKDVLKSTEPTESIGHKKYTRQGMVRRVLAERQQKALHAQYRVTWANNIYGDHLVTNENGVKYTVFLRDFVNETGYSNSHDAAVNKLGTTKHVMYAFNYLKNNKSLYSRLKKTCPFVEVYTNPLNNYAISYFYPHELPRDTALFLSKYFNHERFVEDAQIPRFTPFINESQFFDNIIIRPEVKEK
ncbi:MAG: hypothetical protein HC896_17435 [Bacteroidales bacterium]|nr:hypothetical protein [Bacteroidales bacterium]